MFEEATALMEQLVMFRSLKRLDVSINPLLDCVFASHIVKALSSKTDYHHVLISILALLPISATYSSFVDNFCIILSPLVRSSRVC